MISKQNVSNTSPYYLTNRYIWQHHITGHHNIKQIGSSNRKNGDNGNSPVLQDTKRPKNNILKRRTPSPLGKCQILLNPSAYFNKVFCHVILILPSPNFSFLQFIRTTQSLLFLLPGQTNTPPDGSSFCLRRVLSRFKQFK